MARKSKNTSDSKTFLAVGIAETDIWGGCFWGSRKIWKAGWKGWDVKRKYRGEW